MLFLTYSNANIKFALKKLIWRFYIAIKALSTTKRIKIINKKEFVKVALDKNIEVFVMHLTFLLKIIIYPLIKA